MYAKACAWAEERYGSESFEVSMPGSSVRVGVLSTGSLIGTARANGLRLVLLGSILRPLEGFEGNPLDDPSAVAAHLLARYSRDPHSFLLGVHGQYAVCVIENDNVLLAVDRDGMRTWFYDNSDREFSFSSNLRLLAESCNDIEIDRAYEDFLLLHGYYPRATTTYAHLVPMTPGTMLSQTSGDLTVVYLPSVPVKPRPSIDPTDEAAVIDALYDAIMSALEAQTSSASRAGVLLGGFDSALVAACLMKLGKDVETYSFSYADESYNQPFADELAAHLGIEHHWVEFGPEDIAQGLKHFTDVFNRPTNWPNYVIQTAELCHQMKQDGISQCFSGDGCDSVFLGYPGTFRRARVIGALDHLPRWLSARLLSLLGRPSLEQAFGHPYRVILGVLRSIQRPEPSRTYASFRILDEISLQQLRRDDAPRQAASIETLVAEVSSPHADLPRYRLAYQGKSAVSPNKNKMIGSADLSGISIWSPYMHPIVAGVAKSLPEALMRPSRRTESQVTGKYVLQRMASVKGLLPDEIIYQPKVAAVDAPIDDWYADQLRPTITELWSHLPFDVNNEYAATLIEPKWSERLFREHVMIDKVISHAASLLATYGAFTVTADDE